MYSIERIYRQFSSTSNARPLCFILRIRWAPRVNLDPIFRQVHTSHFKCPQKKFVNLVWEKQVASGHQRTFIKTEI